MHQLTSLSDPRPEAMADVPGVCELPVTRAVVQYRDLHEIDLPGGRIQDIGLALVLEGRYPSSSQVVDLGSAQLKYLDLSTELVILDWVYEPTLEHVNRLVALQAQASESGSTPGADLGRYCFDLALRILGRVGYCPLTRPTILRIGFRDVCRDLDLHEGTSVRIVLGKGRLTRAYLDYDANALLFRTASAHPDEELEEALQEAFPEKDMRRIVPVGVGGSLSYQVRFPLPLSLAEVRLALEGVRRGLGHLLARFEPERYRAVESLLHTFGARETLGVLHIREPREEAVPLRPRRAGLGPVVH